MPEGRRVTKKSRTYSHEVAFQPQGPGFRGIKLVRPKKTGGMKQVAVVLVHGLALGTKATVGLGVTDAYFVDDPLFCLKSPVGRQ